jgi:hypothetical protein
MSDQSARSDAFPFNQKVAEAVSMGIPLDAIVQHLSDSEKPADKLFVQQFKALQTSGRAPSNAGGTDTGKPLSKEQSMLQDAYNFAEENPITTAAAATVGAGLVGFGGYALKERIRTNSEIRREKALAKLEPSEAVKIQREQLELQKQRFAAEQQALIDKEVKDSIEQVRKQQAAVAQQANLTPDQTGAVPDRLQRAQEISNESKQLGIGPKPVAPPAPVVAPVAAPVAPAAPAQPPMTPFTQNELDAVFRGESVGAPISAAPPNAPAPTPSASPNSSTTTAVVNEIKDMIQQTPDPVTGAVAQPLQPVAPSQELRTGTGKPAFAGMGPAAALNKKGEPKFKPDYADINQVPKDYAFVPNAQYIDTPRQNIGLPEYIKAYTDRPFPLTNEQAIQESKEINKLLGRATRAEAKAAGLPPAEITPGITKKTSAGTKPVRVAGTLGALIAIPDLAKANTPGQQAMAGANLLEAVLPPGFMMGSAGEGSTLSPQIVAQQKAYMDNLNRLGSPFAQTEAAQQFRRNEEMTRRIAGRTGAAVPPQYRR